MCEEVRGPRKVCLGWLNRVFKVCRVIRPAPNSETGDTRLALRARVHIIRMTGRGFTLVWLDLFKRPDLYIHRPATMYQRLAGRCRQPICFNHA
jgi:hypothetical protein